MNRHQKDIYNECFYNKCIEALKEARSEDELKQIKSTILRNKTLFVDVRKQLLIFVNAILSINFNNKIVISEARVYKPLINTIKEEEIKKLKNKLNTIKNKKVLFEFKGLLNLLEDNNLIYNSLYKRQQIINYLLKFKSLNYFKVAYININDLNNKYSFLSVKKDKIKFYSKIMLINNIIVFNTLNHDNITVKVLYTNKNDLKVLLKTNKSNNYFKSIFNENKFNISCLDYQNINKLNKEDKIKFYSYLKDNLLDKKNRKLLKNIKNSSYSFIDKEEEKEELIEVIEDIMNSFLFNNECFANYQQLQEYFYIETVNNTKEIIEQIKTIEEEENTFLNNSLEDIEVNIEDYYYY